MSANPLQRGVHATHAVCTLALLATGWLLEFPDLRARVVGGYGREIVRIHLWLCVPFVALPLLALAARSELARELRVRLRGLQGPARRVHLALTLALAALLTLSGLPLWAAPELPLPLSDALRQLHVAASWATAASLGIHLVRARRGIAERLRGITRLGAAPG